MNFHFDHMIVHVTVSRKMSWPDETRHEFVSRSGWDSHLNLRRERDLFKQSCQRKEKRFIFANEILNFNCVFLPPVGIISNDAAHYYFPLNEKHFLLFTHFLTFHRNTISSGCYVVMGRALGSFLDFLGLVRSQNKTVMFTFHTCSCSVLNRKLYALQ